MRATGNEEKRVEGRPRWTFILVGEQAPVEGRG